MSANTYEALAVPTCHDLDPKIIHKVGLLPGYVNPNPVDPITFI